VKSRFEEVVVPVIGRYEGVVWSACDLDFSMFKGKYKKCVIFILPYKNPLTLENYVEQRFFEVHIAAHKEYDRLKNDICMALDDAMIDWFVPPLRTDHDVNLTGTINNKEAACRAGLGWIGRNNLLVTPLYGPQVNILGILTDEDVPVGVPVTRGYCGDCDACVTKCTFRTLTGVKWSPGVGRDEQIDYRLCHDGRNAARARLNRKMACGRCILSCQPKTGNWDRRQWNEDRSEGASP